MFLPQNRVCGGMFRALDCHLTPSELGDRSIWSWGCWLTTDHLSTNCQPPDMTSKSEPILDQFSLCDFGCTVLRALLIFLQAVKSIRKLFFQKNNSCKKKITELRERCEQSNKVKSTICFWLRLLFGCHIRWLTVGWQMVGCQPTSPTSNGPISELRRS